MEVNRVYSHKLEQLKKCEDRLHNISLFGTVKRWITLIMWVFVIDSVFGALSYAVIKCVFNTGTEENKIVKLVLFLISVIIGVCSSFYLDDVMDKRESLRDRISELKKEIAEE